jgi:hypothetical protein
MKIIAAISGVVLLTMAFSACQNPKHPDEIKQIDSLLVIHQQTALFLSQVDSVHAKASRDTFAARWSEIREGIEANPDVVEVKSDPWWDYATLYEANDRSVKKLLRRYQRLTEKHRMNQLQLNTFRTSVKKDQIPADSIPVYLISERDAVLGVHQETSVVVPELVRTLEVLDSLHAYAREAAVHYREILSVKTK